MDQIRQVWLDRTDKLQATYAALGNIQPGNLNFLIFSSFTLFNVSAVLKTASIIEVIVHLLQVTST